jgi:formylglycine-generating enzyme required for sulfatase activity
MGESGAFGATDAGSQSWKPSDLGTAMDHPDSRQIKGRGDLRSYLHEGHGMKMRLLLWLCVIVTSAMPVLPAGAQQRTARVALVIGNASYPDASTPLSTTIRDARSIAEELRRSEFEVDLKENIGKEEMQRAIDAFTGKIRSGTAALFYFSGYGIQAARQTYLIPINAQVWSEADLRRDGFSVDALLAEMNRRGAKVKIVIIDAARRNPFERRFRASAAGLAAIDAPEGTLAMYSAAPGKLINDGSGANSVFVSELIKELRVPNLTAEEVFNRARIGVSRASSNEQVPWVASSLVDEFYFGASRPAITGPSPAPAPAPAPKPAPAPGPAPPVASTPAPTPLPSPTTTTPSEPLRSEAKPGDSFRDCQGCGEMVIVPAGAFDMGSNTEYENPVHRVTIAKPFAIGRYEVTFDEWDRCVEDKGCKAQPDDREWGRGDRPVINVSWLDAKAFVAWLSQKTGQTYRLPSEAEWEYAARAGTNTAFWWGRDVGSRQANCRECNTGTSQQTSPVGSYKPNSFGLYDTAGNAAEWVEDCWNDSYRGAPKDASAWNAGQCRLRGLRGGAYDSQAKSVRSTARFRYDTDVRYSANGFRVVRELQ